ncbi:MAG: hypothetical protein ACERJ1_15190 [Halodesulfovibrio sp.]|uniref:hypothetical protein n=1 Tax=Halodesulfovibrio sp. TaxID=1912772 RepID=UPI00359E9DA3
MKILCLVAIQGGCDCFKVLHSHCNGRSELEAGRYLSTPFALTCDAMRPLSEILHGMIMVMQHHSQWQTAHKKQCRE